MEKQETEIWKDVPGYEGYYQASNLGRIRSLDRYIVTNRKDRVKGCKTKIKGIVLKPSINNKGYYCVHLYKNGKKKYFEVHRAIALAFLNYRTKPYVLNCDHIDNNPLNNRADNLQIISTRENSSKDRPSKYTGASFVKNLNKWKSSIALKGVDIYLGLFDTAKEAHERYLLALKELEDTGDIKKGRKKQSSKYKGVCYIKNSCNWRAMITYKKKTYFIGLYATEIEAHKARQKFEKNLKNERFQQL